MSELPVCPKCGWEISWAGTHPDECHPREGAFAKRLLSRLAPMIKGTMHGYGLGSVAFTLPDDNTIVFDVRGRRVDHIFVSGLSEEQMVKLVRALAEVLR